MHEAECYDLWFDTGLAAGFGVQCELVSCPLLMLSSVVPV